MIAFDDKYIYYQLNDIAMYTYKNVQNEPMPIFQQDQLLTSTYL